MTQRSFRRRSAAALYDAHSGPNMTPMVDVVMVILIFFMASAAILGPEWFVPTRIPKAGSVQQGDPSAQPLKLHITLSREAGVGRVTINGGTALVQEAVPDALREVIGQRDPTQVLVLIDPAESANYEDVVRLHALCKQLGLTKVGLGGAASLATPLDGPALLSAPAR